MRHTARISAGSLRGLFRQCNNRSLRSVQPAARVSEYSRRLPAHADRPRGPGRAGCGQQGFASQRSRVGHGKTGRRQCPACLCLCSVSQSFPHSKAINIVKSKSHGEKPSHLDNLHVTVEFEAAITNTSFPIYAFCCRNRKTTRAKSSLKSC